MAVQFQAYQPTIGIVGPNRHGAQPTFGCLRMVAKTGAQVTEKLPSSFKPLLDVMEKSAASATGKNVAEYKLNKAALWVIEQYQKLTRGSETRKQTYSKLVDCAHDHHPLQGTPYKRLSCSEYGVVAFRTHHWLKASLLTLGRMLSCFKVTPKLDLTATRVGRYFETPPNAQQYVDQLRLSTLPAQP